MTDPKKSKTGFLLEAQTAPLTSIQALSLFNVSVPIYTMHGLGGKTLPKRLSLEVVMDSILCDVARRMPGLTGPLMS